MDRVAIVVLNWNGIHDTRKCIDSLLSQDYDNFNIVLIDNNSTEHNTKQILQKMENSHKKRLKIIYNDSNLGFSGGVNTGIRYTLENKFKYVALFNNDAIADKKWLSELVSAAKKHSAGIVTGLLLHEDGDTIDSTGDWYSTWGLPFPRGRGKSAASANESEFVFGASGGASLYSLDMLRDIGLFDEGFFAYYEDVDISFRAQLAGNKIYYTNRAVAYHKQGATSSKIPGFTVKQTFKNLPLLLMKNVPLLLLPIIGPRFLFAYTIMFINTLRKGTFSFAMQGWLMSITLLPKTLKQRWAIQKKRTVTITYLKSILWHELPPEQTGLRKLISILNKDYR